MPDIEFIGYTNDEIDALVETITPELKNLEFNEHIVFIRKETTSTVIRLNGGEDPFVRIFTRSKERAKVLTDLLANYFDVEIILIEMFTRHKPTKKF